MLICLLISLATKFFVFEKCFLRRASAKARHGAVGAHDLVALEDVERWV